MNRFLLSLCLLLGFGGLVFAQQPPLLDRELFFGDPEISGAQISPDGAFIAFSKPYKNTRNIWVKRTEEPFSAARPITADTKRPIPQFFWSRDSKYILYVQDQGGDENFNVYAVDPAVKPAAGADVPAARNLTDLKGVRVQIFSIPRNDPDTLYIGLNDRDKAWHDLYRLKISTGERTLLRKNTDRVVAWIFDNKEQLRLAARAADNGDTEILRVDPDKFTKIYSCDVLESCDPVRFDKENKRVYLETNKGDNDLVELALLDPATGKTESVESDPLKHVDFGGAIFSDLTDEIVATQYIDDRRRINWKNKAYEADYRFLTGKLPGKELSFGSHTKDENVWLISARSDTEPGESWLFDRKSRKLALQYRVREKLPRDAMASMESVRYPSSDGLTIPAYLTLPKGVPHKNLPVIILPHGGPWARDVWGYNGFAQFLANRGYAVLAPNFRSSTGYGKKFLNAGNLQWGEKMQDDVTWGAKYLIDNGIADPKRIGIMGGSYGGYATLAGVAFTPDTYAAAVAIVAPSNLITLLDSIPPYWEAGRKMFHVRMGDPTTPEGKKQLERQSPLNSAAKIKTPLMVVQGANDPRVNKREADQIVIALRERGFPVEYIVAPDEGHGFQRPVNNMATFAAAEKFLAKYLGGRYQEGATPEVTQRLREITVDPKTVTLAKAVDSASVGAPKPAFPLLSGTEKYKVNLQMGAQSMALESSSEVKEEDGHWVVTDTASTPMGEAKDSSVLEKGTLFLLKRTVNQGNVSIQFEFKDNKATGMMKMGTQEKPVSVDVGGPIFGDSPGAAQVIATLPLAEGYTTMFRNFDLQKQKPKVQRLNVTGSESVTVPAGTFDAFKAEVKPVDGGADSMTVWVDKSSRKVVKMEAVMASMGGAKLTTELLK
ncbi:MAG: prolyl oligopeptidase family serine peptidase [Acidobacteriota bacterium]|nr:prolyl oligopeptidase family serine peptidase [Acidobacteriota bacterium]